MGALHSFSIQIVLAPVVFLLSIDIFYHTKKKKENSMALDKMFHNKIRFLNTQKKK